MNIQRICSAKLNIPGNYAENNSKTANFRHFGLKISQPLTVDTVSFQARGKNVLSAEARAALARQQARLVRDARLIAEANTSPTKKDLSGEERVWGVSLDTARKIPPMINDFQKQVHEFIETVFGGMIASEAKTDNLLLTMSDRAKTPLSIQEKSATRKLNSIKEIMDTESGMTDLNGAKTVMNFKTGKTESEIVIGNYIPLINMGQVRIREIELQRPAAIKDLSEEVQEEFDYVSKKFLDDLEDAQERVINGLEDDPEKIVLVDRPLPKYTKGNYCALHLLVELVKDTSKPYNHKLHWTRPFEHQHVGARVSKGKKFDDKWFKFLAGKEIGESYADLKRPWEALTMDENKAAKERYIEYSRNANLQLRKDEIQENETQKLISRNGNLYITPRDYNLPPEYDLNTQYETMLKCDKKAEKAQKQKEQAEKQAKLAKRKIEKEKSKKQITTSTSTVSLTPIEQKLNDKNANKGTDIPEYNEETGIIELNLTPKLIRKLVKNFKPRNGEILKTLGDKKNQKKS